MSYDEYARAADIDPVRGQLPPRGQALAEAELAALFKSCQADPNPAGLEIAPLSGDRRQAHVQVIGLSS